METGTTRKIPDRYDTEARRRLLYGDPRPTRAYQWIYLACMVLLAVLLAVGIAR